MDIDNDVEKNIKLLAEAKNKNVSDINACVLQRPRHVNIIKKLTDMNVNINYITDGDIAGALSVIGDNPKNDIYYSTGGGPEGVIVAAALSCYGGQIQGRLIFRTTSERNRAIAAGIDNLNKIYTLSDMVTKDVIFAATGVTDGSILRGARWDGNILEMETILMRSKTGSVRRLLYRQRFS